MLEIGEGIFLENNIEYVIVDIIDYNNKKYLVLSNVVDLNDVVVRIYEDECIKGLHDSKELADILKIYMSKN